MIVNLSFLASSGRVYDPDTARFLSADPNIFHPFDPQDFNRYSYVRNNPLKYTDPSGFLWGDDDDGSTYGDWDSDFDDNGDWNGMDGGQQVGDDDGNDNSSNTNNTNETNQELGHTTVSYERHDWGVMEVHTASLKEPSTTTNTNSVAGFSSTTRGGESSGVNNTIHISVSYKLGELETDNSTFTDKDIARGLRNASTVLDKIAGTLFATPTPQTKTAALAIGALSLGAKVAAQILDSQPDDVVRGALIDVMTHDLFGGFYKDFALDIGKAIMDHYSK